MPKHAIELSLGVATEEYERDWSGRIIPVKDAVVRTMRAACVLRSEDFRVATPVNAWLLRDVLPTGVKERDALAFFAIRALVRYFSTADEIDLFRLHVIPLGAYLPKRLPKVPVPTPVCGPRVCKISEECFRSLLSQVDEYREAREVWRRVIDALYEEALVACHQRQFKMPEITRAMNLLERCTDAGFGPDGGYLRGKLRRARSMFHELMQRKLTSHPGYDAAQQDLLQCLSLASPPDAWTERPPCLAESFRRDLGELHWLRLNAAA